MLYLANPCGPAVVEAMAAGRLGLIDTPLQRKPTQVNAAHDAGVAWCADNGCFTDKWDEHAWWEFLETNAHRAATCLFATAPDVVGDAEATRRRASPWLPKIRALGYKAAYVFQNGADQHPIDWDAFDVVFLGGSLECVPCGHVYDEARPPARDEPCPYCHRPLTEWKTGAAARTLVAEAKARGKWVHMGRVNSERRWRYAEAIGCDSVDGTYLTFGPDTNLPKLLAWANNSDLQVALW